MKIAAALLVCLSLFSSPCFAQNGGTRGGGDPYADEVYGIARDIVHNLKQWVKEKTLTLNEAQISAIENLIDTDTQSSQTKKRVLLVLRKEHVYLHPKFLPNLERAQEVALTNVYPSRTPLIEVGKVRWDELKDQPLEKITLVLHELLGAAGLLVNGDRLDRQFIISYKLRLQEQNKWEEFRQLLRTELGKLENLRELQFNPDISHFTAMGEDLEALPAYGQLNDPKQIPKKGDAQDINIYQENLYNDLVIWYDNAIPAFQRRIFAPDHSLKVFIDQQTEASIQKLSLSTYPHYWVTWAVRFIQNQALAVEKARENVNSDLSGGLLGYHGLMHEAFSKSMLETFVMAVERSHRLLDLLKFQYPRIIVDRMKQEIPALQNLYQESIKAVDAISDPYSNEMPID